MRASLRGRNSAAVISTLLLLATYVAHAAPFAYVTNSAPTGNYLSIIDTADNTVAGTLTLNGSAPPTFVTFNPNGTRAYVAWGTSFIDVMDTTTNSFITRIDTGQPVVRMVTNSSGSLLYAGQAPAPFQVIDTATNTVIGTSTLIGIGLVVFNPTNLLFYRFVASGDGVTPNKLEVVNSTTGAVTATITLGHGNSGSAASVKSMALSLDGTRLYVLDTYNYGSDLNSVWVVDTTTNSVLTTISVGDAPMELVLNAAGTRLYVTNFVSTDPDGIGGFGPARLTVVDTTANRVIARTPMGDFGRGVGLAIDPSGKQVYVVSGTGLDTRLAVIGAECNDIATTISHEALGGAPVGVFIPPATVSAPDPSGEPTTLRITGMEVTQGIQDLSNSVRLISGRRTFVRVYVKADGAAVEGVTATLSAIANIACAPGTCPPVGARLGPLVPVNAVGTRITVRPDPKRGNLDDSFLFELPWQWTQYQSLRLDAVLSIKPGLAPKQSCTNDILNAPLHEFQLPATMKVQFVRLRYHLNGSFKGFPSADLEATREEQRKSESFIRRTYPVSTLLSGPDFLLTDHGLGVAVNRLWPQCIAAKEADQNMCAHDYIVGQLASLQATSGFIGDADVAYGLIPNPPNDDKNQFFTRGACCTDRIAAGPSFSLDYAAHEIGHYFGRQHPVAGGPECGHSETDAGFPYFRSFIGPGFLGPNSSNSAATDLAGFDGGDALAPRAYWYGQNAFDIMGYCKVNKWISDYTYNALYPCLKLRGSLPGVTPACGFSGVREQGASQPGAALAGDWLTVYGKIDSAAAAAFIAQRVDRAFEMPERTAGTHSIRLIGAGGVTLADYPFAPHEIVDAISTPGDAPSMSIGQIVPFVAGTQEVQIVDIAAGSAIGTQAVSSNRPAISNITIQDVPVAATGSLTVAWNGSDADGDELTFNLFFTRDGGQTLRPLMLGVSDTSAQIDTAELAGGHGRIRVVATDGVQTGFADSPEFNLADKPPQPSILTPGDATSIYFGQLINLEGTASDVVDGTIADVNLNWSTDSRSLGSGSHLSVTDLPVGVNHLTLKATNSLGLMGTTTVVVNVKANVDAPAALLTAGPTKIGWHVAVGETLPQTSTLNIGNSGQGVLHISTHSDASWLTLSAASGAAPTTLTLTAAPAGFADGTTARTTVTITAVEFPTQVLTIPVSVAVGNTFTVSDATAAPPVTPLPTITITASPTTLTAGAASTLSWSSTDTTTCTASGAWSGAQPITGTQEVSTTTAGNLTFTLSCVGDGGNATGSVSITVNPIPVVTVNGKKHGGGALDPSSLFLLGLLGLLRGARARATISARAWRRTKGNA